MGKQLITRNKASRLGILGEGLVDPQRLEVVAFDLEISRGNNALVPLYTLKEVGDVALVQDDSMLRGQQMGAYGCIKLLGMEVRTRADKVLGKIRDLAFNPDTGIITKLIYDDFGLRFLPLNFFDTYAVPVEYIEGIQGGTVTVATDYYNRPPVSMEGQGLLPNLLRSLASPPATAGGIAGLLSDGSRGGNDAAVQAYAQEQGYSMQEWEANVRAWERETGLSYNEYWRMVQERQPAQLPAGAGGGVYGAAGRNALPAPRQQQQPQPQPQQPQAAAGGRYALPAASSGAAGPAGRSGWPGAASAGAYPLPPQQQPAQAPYGAGYGSGYGTDPRYRSPAPGAGAAGLAAAGGGGGAPQPGMSAAAAAAAQQQQQQQQQRYGTAGASPQQWSQAPGSSATGPQQWGQQQPQPQPQPLYPGQQQPQQRLQPQAQLQPGLAGQGPRGPPGVAHSPAQPGVQQPMQPQQQQQQPQQAGPYGSWPGPGPAGPQQQGISASLPPGTQQGMGMGMGAVAAAAAGAAGAQGGGPGGAGGGGNGALRVDEWLAREGAGAGLDPALQQAAQGRGPVPPPQQLQQQQQPQQQY